MLQNAWSKHSPQPPPQSDTMMFGWCFFCFRFILHPELTINSAKAECAIYMKKAPTNCNGIVLKIILNVCVTLHKIHFNSKKKKNAEFRMSMCELLVEQTLTDSVMLAWRGNHSNSFSGFSWVLYQIRTEGLCTRYMMHYKLLRDQKYCHMYFQTTYFKM